MSLKILLLGGFLILTSCLVEDRGRRDSLDELNECYFKRDSRTGKPLKWNKDKFPISFYIHTSVPDEAYFNFVAAADHWNIRWMEYMEERGEEAGPLVEVVGQGEKFSASGNPIKDDYNMLIFSESSVIGSIMGQQSFLIDEIQAVTYSQKTRSFLGNISLKSADIIVNKTSFEYYYDDEYNEYITAWKASRDPKRRIAFTKIPSRTAFIKNQILRIFFRFLDFFKPKQQRTLARFKKTIPDNMVDFPSLGSHEIGHAVANLGHVDEDEYKSRGLALVSPYRRFHRHLASLDEDEEGDENKDKEGKEKSIMKVELLRGTVRRHVSDFDLGNIYCGYYKNP